MHEGYNDYILTLNKYIDFEFLANFIHSHNNYSNLKNLNNTLKMPKSIFTKIYEYRQNVIVYKNQNKVNIANDKNEIRIH